MKRIKQIHMLVLVAALVFSLCACNIKEPETTAQETTTASGTYEDKSEPVTVRVERRETAHLFPQETAILSIAHVDNTLFMLVENNGEYHLFKAMFSILEDGRPQIAEAEEILISPMPFDGEPILYKIVAGGDGNIYLLAGNNENNQSTVLVVQCYDSIGAYIDCTKMIDWDLMTVDAFSVGNSREFVLAADDTICVYGWPGDLLNRISADGDFIVYSSSCNSEGLVVSVFSMLDRVGHYYAVDPLHGELKAMSLSVDSQSGNQSEMSCRISGSIAPCQGMKNEYLINQGQFICHVDFENDMVTPLIEWNPSAGVDAVIGDSCQLGENTFACLLNNSLMLSYSSYVEKKESGIVRVGVIDGQMSQKTANAVARMNTADCPYIYEISVFNNDKDGLTAFNLQLAADSFDLIVFHDEINTSSPFFEDLYTYLDADDTLSRNSFLPNLLESLSVRGELHQMWNGVRISTMIAKEEFVGDGRGLSMSACERIVEDYSELQSVFDNKFTDEMALKQDWLLNIAHMATAAFVDKAGIRCRFDSEEFTNLLSLCGNVKANPNSNGMDNLLYSYWVGAANDLEYVEPVYGPCSFVGYPDGKDGIHYFELGDYENCMASAIPSNSRNKDGAWYFIKNLLSREQQLMVADTFGAGIPVLYDIAKETSINIADEKHVAGFFALIERTQYAEVYGDSVLIDIIIETSQAYIQGDKTLEETVRLIQARASNYVAEQYG